MKVNRQKGKGFTLIEVLVVIAIIGALAAVIGEKVSNAETTKLSNIVIGDVMAIATGARSWRGSAYKYTGLSLSTLSTAEIVSSTWGTGVGVNPLGGNYTVAVNGTNANYQDVKATGLGPAVCSLVERHVEVATVGGNQASCSAGTLTAVFK